MKIAQYMHQENAIAAADSGGIRERWLWGLRLLADEEKIAPAGGLRHGVATKLIAEAAKRGLRLSEREIQRRLQCARTYPTDAQIRQALADFETWDELHRANFPDYEAPPGEPAADHRTASERNHDRARQLAGLTDPQGTLFPLSQFEPAETTLKELSDYADEQAEITSRFVARDAERRAYLDGLIAAAGDDLSWTWQQAHEAWEAGNDLNGGAGAGG